MSEELEKIKALRPHKHSNEKQSSCTKPSQTSNADLVSTQKKAVVHSKPKVKHTVDSSSSFGGFKKGFLFASSDSKHQVKKKPVSKSQKTSSSPTASQASTKTSAEGNDIPFIKPKDKDKDKSSLEFPEVQQAMKESFPLLQSQGITHASSAHTLTITYLLLNTPMQTGSLMIFCPRFVINQF